MKLHRLEQTCPAGRVVLLGSDRSELEAGLADLTQALERDRRSVEEAWIGGLEGFVKHSPLRGRARVRQGLALRVGRGLDVERELRFLHLLRRHLFLAPRPVAAGFLLRTGWPTAQVLWTEALEGGTPLDAALANAGDEERTTWVAELAREVARLHALGWVHRDLYLRNIIVAQGGDPRRLHFLDARRGGRALPFRGAAFDVGCLFLDAADAFRAHEQHLFLTTYLQERRRQERPVRPAAFLGKVVRARSRQARRIHKRPARARGAALPSLRWSPPSGLL